LEEILEIATGQDALWFLHKYSRVQKLASSFAY